MGIPLLTVLAAAGTGSLLPYEWPFPSWEAALSATALALVIGPVEEFGWRGVLQPLLQQRFAPLYAGLIVGVIWGL